MAESKNDLTENKKKRPNKLTNARIKKEIEMCIRDRYRR